MAEGAGPLDEKLLDEGVLDEAIAAEVRALRPVIDAALDVHRGEGPGMAGAGEVDGERGAAGAEGAGALPAGAEALPAGAVALSAAAEDLADLDAAELLAAFGRGEATPLEVLAATLSRVARRDPAIGAIWATDPGEAEAAAAASAARWEGGDPRPLEGIPVVIKDVIDTRTMPTTGGSRWLAGRRAPADAVAVARLRAAGAVVVAKAATFELACGDEQTPYGVVHNPWDPAATTGGSSAGTAAALAARYVPLGLGTDTGGSIRLPSGFCGVTGLKPTTGAVDTGGVLPLSPTFDTVGPMARSAADVALLLDVLTGCSPPPPGPAREGPGEDLTAGVAGMRVGVPSTWFDDILDEGVRGAWRDTLEVLRSLGASIVSVDIPRVWTAGPIGYTITMAECAAVHRHTPLELLTPAFRSRVLVGRSIPAEHYVAALAARQSLAAEVDEVWGRCDVMVVPGPVSPAPPLDDVHRAVAGVAATWLEVTARTMAPWSVTGLPALAVPAGFDPSGLPLGVQVVGPRHRDRRCLRVGVALQAVTDHHRRRPPWPAG